MSSQAYHSTEQEQVTRLEKYNPILHTPLETIESARRSARCMLAEVFLSPGLVPHNGISYATSNNSFQCHCRQSGCVIHLV